MGTSLASLTPASTYTALLKTTDNLSITNVLKTISDGSGNDTTLQLSTLRVGLLADTSVTTQTSAVIQATTTNANLVLNPNGTGAIVASIPDGTATGGNARGANAVDLQTTRSANTNVASGINSIIGGGISNTASHLNSSVLGGSNNRAGNTYSSILGGQNNTTGESWSAIVGGISNTTSGIACVAGGNANTNSGRYAITLGGGHNVSGRGSIALGEGNTSTADYAFSSGYAHTSSSSYSTNLGAYTNSYLLGQVVSSGGWDQVTRGKIQYSFLNPFTIPSLTTGATANLSLDGSGSTNLIIPTTNRAWNVTVKWVAVVTVITGTATGVTVGDTITQVQTLGFKRVGGTSSLVGTANTISTNSNTSMSTASMTYTAGASQELAMTFTAPTFAGGGTITCRVVAKVELTEVAW